MFPMLHSKRKFSGIRSTTLARKISHATNPAAEASVKAMKSLKEKEFTVKSIQEFDA
jgi:carbamoyl-phosphate synthase large subunit